MAISKDTLDHVSFYGGVVVAMSIFTIGFGIYYKWFFNPLTVDPLGTDVWVQFLHHNALAFVVYGGVALLTSALIMLCADLRIERMRKKNRFVKK